MLSDRQDAYGHMLQDCLRGVQAFEVDEREDGFVGAFEAGSMYLAPFSKWPPHQRRAMTKVRGRVLDVGVGAGRHALYLQERGHEVVGIDVSPLALEVCRQRGLKETRLLSLTQADASLGRFDTVLMLGNNFGLFGGYRRARWLLRRLRGLTTPGARIVAESTDPYQTEVPGHLAYHRHNLERGRMAGQIRLRIRYQGHCTPWFDYLLASREEVAQIVQDTGWRVAHYYDSPGAAYVAVIERHL